MATPGAPQTPIKPTNIGGIALSPAGGEKDSASSPLTFDGSNRTFNVVKNYRWTVSDVSKNDEIPHIMLTEHRNLESNIMRMVKFYTGINIEGLKADEVGAALKEFTQKTVEAGKQAAERGGQFFSNLIPGIEQGPKPILDVYDEIFPDCPTSLKYIFPYFTKAYMSLDSAPWEQVDKISKTAGEATTGLKEVMGAFSDKMGAVIGGLQQAASIVGNVAQIGMSLQYPLVGANDRPRVFSSHSERSVTIEFPLYNTIHESDWKRNRLLLQVLMSQNLFIKRDYMTGLPPVFYRVLVPGQYFSFASSVTKIDVQNLGNIRMMYEKGDKGLGKGVAIPDAWQVSLTLTELTMPSLNQYQAAITPIAYTRVSVG